MGNKGRSIFEVELLVELKKKNPQMKEQLNSQLKDFLICKSGTEKAVQM